jgi:hypothetical protein
MPRSSCVAPLVADGATASIAVQKVQQGSPAVEEVSEFRLFLPLSAAP